MKIALFSDIHANLPALEACLAHMDAHQPDAVYCLGDLVGYNVWPNEVIETIRQRGIPVIAGNYDEGIGLNSDSCGCAYKTEEDRAMGKISIAYTNDTVSEASRGYLRGLPAHIRISFPAANGPVDLLLVHGSPRRINEYLFEDREEQSLMRILKQSQAHILCFGHTHKPFHRILQDGQDGRVFYRHAINTGSVGKPKDGNPQGCYVLLELDASPDLADAGSVRVRFERFSYDVARAARAVEQSPLPDAFARMLREGC